MLDSKSSVRFADRGFESHPLRQIASYKVPSRRFFSSNYPKNYQKNVGYGIKLSQQLGMLGELSLQLYAVKGTPIPYQNCQI